MLTYFVFRMDGCTSLKLNVNINEKGKAKWPLGLVTDAFEIIFRLQKPHYLIADMHKLTFKNAYKASLGAHGCSPSVTTAFFMFILTFIHL